MRLPGGIRGGLARAVWRLEPPWRTARPPAEAELSVLVVCQGNYCRSPVAEAALRRSLTRLGLGERVSVASAGTSGYYRGRHPHRLARVEAARDGLDVTRHRSTRLDAGSLDPSTVVVAVDERTRRALVEEHGLTAHEILMLGDFGDGGDVVDPNGRDADVFASVHSAILRACDGLAGHLAERLATTST